MESQQTACIFYTYEGFTSNFHFLMDLFEQHVFFSYVTLLFQISDNQTGVRY